MSAKRLNARCYSCRQMRLRCDGSRPSCSRCAKASIPCPGYADPLFISMNEVSTYRASSVAAPKKAGAELWSTRHGFSAYGAPTVFAPLSSSAFDWNRIPREHVLPPMNTDWTHEAICFFFSLFVIPSTGPEFDAGFLDFLPTMYFQTLENVHLKEAVRAISLSTFARHSRIPDLNLEARRHYGRALRSTMTALNNETTMKSDQSLATLTLLSFNELIHGDEETPLVSHHAAQLTLIKRGVPTQNRSQAGLQLCRTIYTREQLADLVHGAPPRLLSSTELQILFPSHVTAEIYGLLLKIAIVCEATRNFVHKNQAAKNGVQRETERLLLTESAIKLDTETLGWSRKGKENLEYGLISIFSTLTTSCGLPTIPFPRTITIFRSLIHATIWIRFWSGRLYLLHALHDCVMKTMLSSGVPPPTTPSETYIYHSLSEVVDAMCGSIPYLLGEISEDGTPRPGLNSPSMGAVLATVCLSVASSARGIEQARLDWISEKLLHIGNSNALRKALILRNLLASKRRGL